MDRLQAKTSALSEEETEFLARQKWTLDIPATPPALLYYWPLLTPLFAKEETYAVDRDQIEPVLTVMRTIEKLTSRDHARAEGYALLQSCSLTPCASLGSLLRVKVSAPTFSDSEAREMILELRRIVYYAMPKDFRNCAPVVVQCCTLAGELGEELLIEYSYRKVFTKASKFISPSSPGITLEEIFTDASVLYDDLVAEHGDEYKLSALGALLRVYNDVLHAQWGAVDAITASHFDSMKLVHKVVGEVTEHRPQQVYNIVWKPFRWLDEAALRWVNSTRKAVEDYCAAAVLTYNFQADVDSDTQNVTVLSLLSDVFAILHQQQSALSAVVCSDYDTLFESFCQCMKTFLQGYVADLVLRYVLPNKKVEAILRANTISKFPKEFEIFLKAVHASWSETVIPKYTLDAMTNAFSIEGAVRDAVQLQLSSLARSVLDDPVVHRPLCEELYTIDMRHYKKYKHDKKVLAQSPSGHLVPGTTTTMHTVFDALDLVLTPVILRTDLRRALLYSLYEAFSECLLHLVLDGGELRWFHETQSEALYADTSLVIEFFENSCGDGVRLTVPKALQRLQQIITGVMTATSEDLVRQYESLPHDATVLFSQPTVRCVLSHRKDQTAKKFVAKLPKK